MCDSASEDPEDDFLQLQQPAKPERKMWPDRTGNHSGANILTFAFENVVVDGKRWSADCLTCITKRTKSDKKGTTSNFLAHVRQVHPEVFAEYAKTQANKGHPLKRLKPTKRTRASKSATTNHNANSAITSTSRPSTSSNGGVTSIAPHIPRRPNPGAVRARREFLNDLVVQALIIGDGLPLTLGEGEGFRSLMGFSEPGWVPWTGREIMESKLPLLSMSVKTKVKEVFDAAASVSLTLDLRRREGFAGVVVGLSGHAAGRKFAVQSELLAARYLPDGLTESGDLRGFVRDTVADYQIGQKVFSLVYAGFRQSSTSRLELPGFSTVPRVAHQPNHTNVLMSDSELPFVSASMMTDNHEAYGSTGSPSRNGDPHHHFDSLCCDLSVQEVAPFSQTLQLVISDGFRACQRIEPLVSLLARLSRSFGGATRSSTDGTYHGSLIENGSTWTLQLKSLGQILTLNPGLDGGITFTDAVTQNIVKLDARELSLLHTFIEILRPLQEATDRAQSSHASISTIAPHIAGIYRRLLHFFPMPSSTARLQRDLTLVPLVDALKESLESRFHGLLYLLGYAEVESLSPSGTFGDELHLAATFLDPTYKDYWVEEYISEYNRATLSTKMREAVQRMATDLQETLAPSESANLFTINTSDTVALPQDCGLDSFRRPKPVVKAGVGVASELKEYYEDVTSDVTDLQEYWTLYEKRFPRLARLVRRLVSVPASSTPFPLGFSQRDWACWVADPSAVSLVFLRYHKALLDPLKPPRR
ncbi:hypothetical protein BV898_12145 [Hypsibius exemplaris]|uniref:BED-type domain-containing protein n=1 Tax=Hypsibius exemplaris TaxID=2072580 RepID=A0A1W0WEJ8_HYPEX|nr:hypothetical protein BV898_12145 [Hypsibius exemplaris]